MKSWEISLHVSLGKQAANGNVEVEDSGKLPILSDAASRALPQFAISSRFSDLLLRHPLMEVQVAFCPRMHSRQISAFPSCESTLLLPLTITADDEAALSS